jgi:spore coat protein U-like protein
MLGCCTGNQAVAQTFSVSATGMAFGAYQPLSGSTVTTTATVTVTCTPPGGVISIALLVPYTVTLSIGGGSSFAARSMGGANPRLGYQIYTDAGYSTVWGDGTAGTSIQSNTCIIGTNLLGTLLSPIPTNYTAYGRILAGTSASVGTYTDMITVTVTY